MACGNWQRFSPSLEMLGYSATVLSFPFILPLQVAPLFAILQAMPKTPEDGQSFLGNLGDETTRRELQARLAESCFSWIAGLVLSMWCPEGLQSLGGRLMLSYSWHRRPCLT